MTRLLMIVMMTTRMLVLEATKFATLPASGLQAHGEEEVLRALAAACLSALFLVAGEYPEARADPNSWSETFSTGLVLSSSGAALFALKFDNLWRPLDRHNT